MLVASSFPSAPRRKTSRGKTFLRFSRAFFSCSNMVYCNIGLITSTKAGNTPAKSAVGPSSLNRDLNVANVEGALADFELVGRLEDDFLAVIRVLTTQIGFVMSTVALPAIAPAIIDSSVVSLDEARLDLMAARSKNALVHSYPKDVRD